MIKVILYPNLAIQGYIHYTFVSLSFHFIKPDINSQFYILLCSEKGGNFPKITFITFNSFIKED